MSQGDSEFAGRVALVTGGLGVIGSAIVAALRERGARVVCADAGAQLAWASADAQDLASQPVQLDGDEFGLATRLECRVVAGGLIALFLRILYNMKLYFIHVTRLRADGTGRVPRMPAER